MPMPAWKRAMIGLADAVQSLLLPLGLRSSRKIAGHRITFNPGSHIGMHLLATGEFEGGALGLCGGYIGPESVVLDIGANIGTHAVHFASLARNGTVLCFEPARATFAELLRNVSGLRNVVPLNIALADTSGLKQFFVASDNAYSSLKDTGRKPIVRQESIACFAADEILPPLLHEQRLDFVKIDVEGFETQVLQGLRGLITRYKPVIFCEILGAGGSQNPDPEGTVRLCRSMGYDAFVVSGARLVRAERHDDNLYNYFFIPQAGSTR